MERNYYKLKNTAFSMIKGGKRGQLAIFVIIAVVIVAIILVIMLYPKIRTLTNPSLDPTSYLKSCIGDDVKNSVKLLAAQGGYANPEGFLVYNNQKIKFLCYTNEYYKTCVIQEPMLTTHFEQEMNKLLATKATDCITKLKQEYESRGYSITGNLIDTETTIEPQRIRITFNAPITITKDSTQRFDKFDVKIDSHMFDLLAISQSIVEYEAAYGDSETTLYLAYYPNLRIDKTKLSDGTKIYVVSDVITKESFTFASRSLSWPPGYGVK